MHIAHFPGLWFPAGLDRKPHLGKVPTEAGKGPTEAGKLPMEAAKIPMEAGNVP
jgi:hypothetical protein